MTTNTQPPDNNPPHKASVSTPRPLSWGMIWTIAAIVFAFAVWASPTYSFHPMCTYAVNARMTADVEIAGQKLSSTVVYQKSHSRQWIAGLNSAGCQALYGTALTYKLANDRVLLVPTHMCHGGAKVLASAGHVDVLSACTGKQAHQDRAFIVDSATRPTKWFAVTNGDEFRITSMTATSTWSNPADDIATLAPNLLKSTFKYGRQAWSRSPETVLSFERRYGEVRHKADKAFDFEVQNESFDIE